jgi:hypothetical protein
MVRLGVFTRNLLKLIFYTMLAEVARFQRVAILKAA